MSTAPSINPTLVSNSAKPAAPAPFRFNPLLPEFPVDPHPQYHRLRTEDPVHYSTMLNAWVITRYADVHAILRDERFSCEGHRWEHYEKFILRGGSVQSPMAEMYSKWMLQLDPPDHTRIRGLVNKAFTPRVAERMRPRIQEMVDGLIDGVIASGRMDLLKQLSMPLPIMVISDLLGMPREDFHKIHTWTTALLPSLSPAISAKELAKVNEVMVEYREYFRALARERQANPKDDLISALLAASDQHDKLSEVELLATCILIAFAGHATTSQLVAKGMFTILSHPTEMQKLRENPDLIVSAVEEVCRYDSPLQMLFRFTKETVELGGKTIKPRQFLLVSLAAANRDPTQFTDPDRFDIVRDSGKHMAFGYGIHYCVGAALGRLESQIAINTLLQRLPNLQLDREGIRRESSLLLRGFTSLPVTFQPGSPRTRTAESR